MVPHSLMISGVPVAVKCQNMATQWVTFFFLLIDSLVLFLNSIFLFLTHNLVASFLQYGESVGWQCECCGLKVKALSCREDGVPSARNDHEKSSGKFRGISCDPCNLCFGWVEKIAKQVGKVVHLLLVFFSFWPAF